MLTSSADAEDELRLNTVGVAHALRAPLPLHVRAIVYH